MLLTEAEAKERWCPMSRTYGYEGSSTNREATVVGEPKQSCRCVASGCAMWRWRVMIDQLPGTTSKFDMRPMATEQGYCGLAGTPAPYVKPPERVEG